VFKIAGGESIRHRQRVTLWGKPQQKRKKAIGKEKWFVIRYKERERRLNRNKYTS